MSTYDYLEATLLGLLGLLGDLFLWLLWGCWLGLRLFLRLFLWLFLWLFLFLFFSFGSHCWLNCRLGWNCGLAHRGGGIRHCGGCHCLVSRCSRIHDWSCNSLNNSWCSSRVSHLRQCSGIGHLWSCSGISPLCCCSGISLLWCCGISPLCCCSGIHNLPRRSCNSGSAKGCLRLHNCHISLCQMRRWQDLGKRTLSGRAGALSP